MEPVKDPSNLRALFRLAETDFAVQRSRPLCLELGKALEREHHIKAKKLQQSLNTAVYEGMPHESAVVGAGLASIWVGGTPPVCFPKELIKHSPDLDEPWAFLKDPICFFHLTESASREMGSAFEQMFRQVNSGERPCLGIWATRELLLKTYTPNWDVAAGRLQKGEI